MRTPCDEAMIRREVVANPCLPNTRLWVLIATILGSSLAFIDSTVVNVALPAIQANFHTTVVDVQWIVESYGLFLGALILVGGSLGDRFGRRLIFEIGIAIFALASAGCGAASNIDLLIIARSIQGVGAALLVPGSLAIISSCFDENSRGQAIGTWSGFTAITTAIGPVLGGWLVEHASWRWVFFINLPLAIVVIAISRLRIPESRSVNAGHIDWPGAATATIGLGAVIFAPIESVNLGWRNPAVLVSLLGGVVCLVAFVFIEANSKSPMLSLALFRSRSFSGANLLTFLLYAAMGTVFFLLPLNLIQVQKYSPTAAGAAILPLILIIFFLSRWSGGLVARYGARLPLVIGPFVVALGFGLLAMPSIGYSYWKELFPALVVLGLGMAFTIAPLTTTVMNSVSVNEAGAASGVNNAVARIAGVLAIAVFGVVIVKAFGFRLNSELTHFSLAPGVLQSLLADRTKLAGLPTPGGLDAATKIGIESAIRQAFVFGYRIVMVMCAALSLASGVVAGLMIPAATNRHDAGKSSV